MIYEEWIARVPVCPTCGKALTTSKNSFGVCMRRYGRPPAHCKGHNPQKKERKYLIEYEIYIMEKHICVCGCGEILQPAYRAFVASMVDYGRGPLRKQNHHKNRGVYKNSPKKESIVFDRHGCRIVLAKKSCRCREFLTCSHYENCLNFVVTEKKAVGWKTI